MTPSKEALERAWNALINQAQKSEADATSPEFWDAEKIISAELDRAAAKEIQDYLDGKEEEV